MIKKILNQLFLGKISGFFGQNNIRQNMKKNGQKAIGRNLNLMFHPNSIAIIGASLNEKKLGSIVLKNIMNSGFKGDIFPLNLKSSLINGFKAYKDYNNLPIVPDLALISIPAKFVLDVLEKIVNKGTKNIVIFSAGFKESGLDGLVLEKKLLAIVKNYNSINESKINILGPNCLGFVNNLKPLNTTFGQLVNKKGNLRFISQSGAIASSIFDWAEFSGIGFSEFITIGNKTDLNENDVLKYFFDHQINTETNEQGNSGLVPIGLYLESIVDGKEFIKITKKISNKNPIFILKPGKSDESKKAMKSHTGSIAGEDYVFSTALKKANIIRCDGVEDFFDLAKVFAWEKPPAGKKIAVISNAGGPAVLSSDFVISEEMELAQFDDKTKKELEKHLPRAASVINPVDVLGDALAQRYKNAIETLIINDDVDSLLVILTPQVMTQIEETAKVIGELSFKYGKPIFCSFMGGSSIIRGEQVLNKFKIPSFRYPERAIKAIARMYRWNKIRKVSKQQKTLDTSSKIKFNIDLKSNTNPKFKIDSNLKLKNNQILKTDVSGFNTQASKIISSALDNNRKILSSFEANKILSLYKIKNPATQKCETIDDAKNFIKTNNFPVVLKVSSSNLLHKSDKNGVIVGINSDEKLQQAFFNLEKIKSSLVKSEFDSIQIQKQVSKGIELIIGSKKDSDFGDVLMFGAGGVLANLIEDRNLGLIPLSRDEIISMIKSSKVYKLIKGYRGKNAYDLKQLVDLIFKLQILLDFNRQISELDINPVILNSQGAWAVDGKIILR